MQADALVRSRFMINHLTIQIEVNAPVELTASTQHFNDLSYMCGNDIHN